MDHNSDRALQLRKIELNMQLASTWSFLGPAGKRALLASFATVALAELARHYMIDVPFLASVALGVLVGSVILQRAPYKSYAALIYDLLTVYQPKDVAAYKELQTETAAYGLRRHAIEAWMAREWHAISVPRHPSEEQQRSANNRVDLHLVRKD